MASCKRFRADVEESEATADLSWLWSDAESSKSDEAGSLSLHDAKSRYECLSCIFWSTNDDSSSTDSSKDGTAAPQERAQSPHEHSEPLFEGSRVSALEAYTMIFQYALRHHLTSKAFSELLLLLQALLPAANLLPKSLYLLKNVFLKAFPNICINEHYYCQACHTPCDPASLHQCSNELCADRIFDHFITVPLGPQLQEMMKGMHTTIKQVAWITQISLCRQIHLVFSKREALKPNSGNICDVYDGVQYKKWKCFLNEPANISLLLNTDGVAIFRSSKFSIWPVWCVINELPKSQRYVYIYVPYHTCKHLFCLFRFLRKTCCLLAYGIVGTNPPWQPFWNPLLKRSTSCICMVMLPT